MKIRVKTNEIDFKVINRISGFRLEDLGFIYILYIYTFLVCLSNCLCPINVKTVKLIGTKFCVGPHMTPGKVYGWSKLKNKPPTPPTKFEFHKIKKIHEFFFMKLTNFWTMRKCSQLKGKMGGKRSESLVS